MTSGEGTYWSTPRLTVTMNTFCLFSCNVKEFIHENYSKVKKVGLTWEIRNFSFINKLISFGQLLVLCFEKIGVRHGKLLIYYVEKGSMKVSGNQMWLLEIPPRSLDSAWILVTIWLCCADRSGKQSCDFSDSNSKFDLCGNFTLCMSAATFNLGWVANRTAHMTHVGNSQHQTRAPCIKKSQLFLYLIA